MKIQNISKSYGTQVVLDNLNLSLIKGEIVGLLGRNGAGKTTLLRILSGIIESDDGIVIYPSIEKEIGYLSERNPLYPDMYVAEYLEFIFALSHNTKNKTKISDLILKIGLKEVQHKKISQLSKGFKQRVGLAAALLGEPEILILDEPINGLDPVQIEDYRNIVKEYGRDKIVILSSHLIQEIEAICDRVVMIKDHVIVEDKYLSSPRNQWILSVTLNKELTKEKFEVIHGLELVEFSDQNNYVLSSSCDIRKEVFDIVVANESKILEMKLLDNSITELFEKV